MLDYYSKLAKRGAGNAETLFGNATGNGDGG